MRSTAIPLKLDTSQFTDSIENLAKMLIKIAEAMEEYIEAEKRNSDG